MRRGQLRPTQDRSSLRQHVQRPQRNPSRCSIRVDGSRDCAGHPRPHLPPRCRIRGIEITRPIHSPTVSTTHNLFFWFVSLTSVHSHIHTLTHLNSNITYAQTHVHIHFTYTHMQRILARLCLHANQVLTITRIPNQTGSWRCRQRKRPAYCQCVCDMPSRRVGGPSHHTPGHCPARVQPARADPRRDAGGDIDRASSCHVYRSDVSALSCACTCAEERASVCQQPLLS